MKFAFKAWVECSNYESTYIHTPMLRRRKKHYETNEIANMNDKMKFELLYSIVIVEDTNKSN